MFCTRDEPDSTNVVEVGFQDELKEGVSVIGSGKMGDRIELNGNGLVSQLVLNSNVVDLEDVFELMQHLKDGGKISVHIFKV